MQLFCQTKAAYACTTATWSSFFNDAPLDLVIITFEHPDTERIIKNIRNLFKTINLKITIEAGMQQTYFLDVTFNADNGKYWPYKKPNSQLQYIHTQSNHPPNIKKQLPKMIEKRLSGISYNQEKFDRAKPAYAQALEKSGYKQKLEFQTDNSSRRRQRKWTITWFNPPFSHNVSTNIGRKNLNLLDKHSPPPPTINCTPFAIVTA